LEGGLKETVTVIFLITYLGVAIGKVPGLALDRTGIALLGAVAMIVSGAIDTQEAVLAVHMPTILLLYALMIISAQFRLGGFYTKCALSITRLMERPKIFLLMLMLTSGVLSAFLANDIVCLAFTPVIVTSILLQSRDPVPHLIALAVSSNIGSASTIIGNPQNMIIGQMANLNFWLFTLWSFPPTLMSLFAAYSLILLIFGKRLESSYKGPTYELEESWPPYDSHQSRKGIIAVCLLLTLFFFPIPRELVAICVAGWLLMSRRMKTRSILGLVDWHLITLFCSLFILIAAIEKYNIPQDVLLVLERHGLRLEPFSLSIISVILSNLTSNVPAVMLLTKFLDPGQTTLWYVLAISSTFAGNLITLGSIANLIVIEEASLLGINIGFWEHAKIGIPVTIVSLIFLILWTYI